MKLFGITFEYALYDMSYANLSLYGAAMPSYSSKKDNKTRDEHADADTFSADDPRNRNRLDQFFKNIRN